MIDRRRNSRWQLHKSISVKLEGAERCIQCCLKNISFRGMHISLIPSLPNESVFRLTIMLTSEISLYVEAWNVWHFRTKDGFNHYGFYFSELSEQDKRIIYDYARLHCPGDFTRAQHYRGDEHKEEGAMDIPAFEDKRVFARFLARFPLRFLDLASDNETEAYTCDISAKGIGLETSRELLPHTPLEMWIKTPDTGQPLYTRGEVVWSKMVTAGTYRAGVMLEIADLMGISRLLRTMAT